MGEALSRHELEDLIAAFRAVPTAILSDNLSRSAGLVGLLPFYTGPRMCGPALTVRTRAGDNLAIHRALEAVTPGDILVVDGGGDVSRALVGEIMKEIALFKRAGGFVIDGAVRDVDAFRTGDFPCFARAVTHRGPYKDGPGEIGVPVSVGGWVVSPGDIVVGDEDGVVSFPPSAAPALLKAAHAQTEREQETLAAIRNGTYSGSYARTGAR